mmetsp:Transcript_56404/g.155783  ORF Transcript_56404/g.155783 Transcript_56404/m.155783 type:complete len:461 (+) Transcript_56404:38-1420(+)
MGSSSRWLRVAVAWALLAPARAALSTTQTLEGVGGVLQHFCSQKPCVLPLKPLRHEVEGVGAVTVAVGQEVADAVEAWALAARVQGLPLGLDGVAEAARALCIQKKCNRGVALPPAQVDLEGVGTVTVPFGREPSELIEVFAAQAYTAGHGLLPFETHQAVMANLCAQMPCHVPLTEKTLEIEGVGEIRVAVGQEVADAVRTFVDNARRAGHAVGTEGATAIMERLCSLKKCNVPLDLGPDTLKIENIGTVVVGLGEEPSVKLLDWLERVREAGQFVGADAATKILQNLCHPSPGRKVCRVPLNVATWKLNVTGVGMLTVPFGAEPADSVLGFVESAVAAGHVIDVEGASMMMEQACQAKKCYKQLDAVDRKLEVEGVGTIPLPFGHDPTTRVTNFLHQARQAGHRIDATAATQIMQGACGMRKCHRPLDVADFQLKVKDIGTLAVRFGEDQKGVPPFYF